MMLKNIKHIKEKQPSVLQMVNTMKYMCEASDIDDLLEKFLNGAIDLICPSVECRAVILKFNSKSGYLQPISMNIKNWRNDKFLNKKLAYGKGIVGQSLKIRSTIKVDDVHHCEYSYNSYWEDTVSEIAVPIIAKNLPARVGINSEKCGEKIIGVINIESNNHAFFTPDHQEILEQLAGYAAILIEKIDHSHKFSEIRELENELAKKRKKAGINYDRVINEMINSIGKIFQFDFINISLVDPNTKNNLNSKIRSKYIYGLSREETEEFKKMAIHEVSGDDIQADVVRKGLIEVPSSKDSRFDKKIYFKFGHEKLVRVFMPILETSSDEIFGTVEAGYNFDFCSYIFEDDIRILKSLVWHIASLIEQQRSSFVEIIIHELSSPLSAIRSHASFVQMKVSTCNNDRIVLKMSDILNESEMIVNHIDKLAYMLQGQTGQLNSELDIQNVNLFTDVITRITFQRKPDLIELGLPTNIKFDISEKLKKIYIRTNLSKLGQVIHNLMDNAIKYRNKNNPMSFKVNVVMKESSESIYIYFQDWGIGIKEEYKQRIFDEGFRAPEIIRWELGSGLGLAISKAIMLQLGGNLEVRNLSLPTEFKLTLPKDIKTVRIE